MASIKYKISIENPLKHQFSIHISFMPTTDELMHISLPNWIPGSYMIRDFAKHVLELKAHDESGELSVNTIAKNRFSISHNQQEVTVSYLYYAFDMSVRKAYLDQEFGFINPASALFCVDELKEQTCLVELVKPTNPIITNWQPASGLTGIDHNDCFNWSHYSAANYLEFTDYPILFGELDIAEFSVANTPHFLVTVGQHFGDVQRAAKDLKPLCQYHIDMFDGLPQGVDKYLFLTMVTDSGFGGLEHLNSTALVCSRFDIINLEHEIDDNYSTFLSLCSHEYLHTWNVKRLKPKEFIPYQLEQEVYTKQLWFYEGMTSYFDDLSLVETNTITQKKYLEILAKTFTRIEKGQGQLRQSVTESSLHTWTKFYQQDEAAPDQIVSYYQKGAAIACLMDLVIKQNSQGKKSLKDLMNKAWHLFGTAPIGTTPTGTTQEDLEDLFKSFISVENHELLHNVLYKTHKIDLTDAFASVGVELTYQTQQNGAHAQGIIANSQNNWLGCVTALINGNLVVKQVLENSPAEHAGIAVNDHLIAIDSFRLNNTNIEKVLSTVQGKVTTVHYFRKDKLYQAPLNVEPSPEFVASLTIKDAEKAKLWLGESY
jgi:predicted metalloprotease with PDZ domain